MVDHVESILLLLVVGKVVLARHEAVIPTAVAPLIVQDGGFQGRASC
jgi:hypothetical protein